MNLDSMTILYYIYPQYGQYDPIGKRFLFLFYVWEGTMKEQRDGGVQVIARAAKILRALALHREGLSLSQIAREVDLARSTVHRIVLALETEHFVTTATPQGNIRLGLGLVFLAAAVNSELRDELHPYLEELSEETDETVDLSVLNEGKVLFIDQIAVPHRLQAVSAVGAHFPLHCTANGKALLAQLAPGQVELLLPKQLEPFTSHTLSTREQLLEELIHIRAEGVAYDREEHTEGICAVGIAIPLIRENRAAITIVLPSVRFYDKEQNLAALLQTIYKRINGR
jgi:DNA-binding IclR family transcriptional regulator